jgi:probable HAF family extracellular repeat protein
MMKKPMMAAIAALVLASPGVALAATTSTVTVVTGVNDTGMLTGYYGTASGTTAGFIESGGTFTTIDIPGSQETIPEGINNAGEVVGFFRDTTGTTEASFIYNSNGFITFSDPAAEPNQTYANSINNNGVIAGTYGAASDGKAHGFNYDGAAFTTISDPAATYRGTALAATNDFGDSTGSYFVSPAQPEIQTGFIETGGVFENLAVPGAVDTFPNAINDNGEVVGYFSDSLRAHGFSDIGGVFTTFDVPQADPGSTFAQAVNSLGTIGGYYFSGPNVYGFLDVGGQFTTITDPDSGPFPAVPEPPTWAAMILGVLLLGTALRYNRGRGRGTIGRALRSRA